MMVMNADLDSVTWQGQGRVDYTFILKTFVQNMTRLIWQMRCKCDGRVYDDSPQVNLPLRVSSVTWAEDRAVWDSVTASFHALN